MKDLGRLLGYARPYAGRFAGAVVASGLAAVFTVLLPALAWPLVDLELHGSAARGPVAPLPVEAPSGLVSSIPRFVAWIPRLGPSAIYLAVLLAFLGKGLFGYLSRYLMSWVGQRAVADLRRDLGRALARQSVGFYAERSTGALITRVTSDTEKILVALSDKLSDLVKEPMTMLALVGYLFLVEWPLALVSLVVAPVVVVPLVRYGRKLRGESHKSQERVADLSNALYELIKGIRLVKASGTEAQEARRVAHAARRVFAANMRAERVIALTPPLMELLAGFGIALAFLYGRQRIASGAMTQGEFLSFFIALFMLYTPGKKLSRVQSAFEQALAGAQRGFALLDTPVQVEELAAARDLEPIRKEIRLEDVSFRYHERWVLRHLDVTLKAGSVTALVGRSGSGKTTVANLLLRFYDPTEGRILCDGKDVREVSFRSLRRQVGLVAQDVVLFNDTLAANIAYGLDGVPRERVEEAARLAFAHEFIAELPQGYDTRCGESGVRLSAGQRQRISIARALLKDPPLLILDEATSALDAESEDLIVRALDRLMQGRTTLVIAHRLSTVRRADLILVLEDGRLRESGTHEELMGMQGGLYNRLAELQAVGEIS